MKTTRVTVHFANGLHARPAAKLVRLFRGFRSKVLFRLGSQVANAGSIMSILLLSAAVNTQLEVQASGDDEDAAIGAVEVFFQSDDADTAPDVGAQGFSDPRGSPPPVSN